MSLKKKVLIIIIIFLFIIAWLLNIDAYYYTESPQWQNNLTASQFSSTIFGDINGDGNSDLILIGCTFYGELGCSNYIAKVYINNGTTFNENSTWEQNLTAINYGSLAFGDINNDGKLDLAMSGCNSGGGTSQSCNDNGYQIFIYINNGTSFVESSQWQSNLTKSWKGSLAFGDINNDGKLDLALNGQSSSSKISKIYINNGSTLMENSTWQSNLTAVYESAVALGDINNDGNLDLVICGDSGLSDEVSKVYLNNGSSLIENTIWEQNLLNVDLCSLAFGDYDNNGKLDLSLIGHTTQDNHRIYRNNGSTFIEIENEINDLLGIFEGSLAFGDVDNDGYLDLIATGDEGYTTLYLYNISGANFTTYSQDQEVNLSNLEKGSSLAFQDMDSDKDLDLILTGYLEPIDPQIKIYISNASLTKNNTLPTPPNTFTSTYSNNVLTLVWNNGSDAETNSTGLYYNLMIGNSTTNHTVVSGVYGGSSNPTAGYFGNMMQRKNITLNIELQASETYYWYVQTIDTGLAKSNWSERQSFSTGSDVTKPSVTILDPSPSADLHTTNPFFTFNASIVDANVKNVTLYADWTGSMIANETNTSAITSNYSFTKNLTGLSDGLYSWYIYSCDTSSNCQSSATRSFYLDRAYPLVYLESPANGNTWTSSLTVMFDYNVSDTDIANCSLIINGAVDQTDTSITENTSQSFTKTLSNRAYTWSVNCTDYVSYINNSETRSLTVSYTAPVSPGGGGSSGGSSSSSTTTITPVPKEFDIDFSTETTGSLEAKQGDVKTFSFQGEVKHSITTLTVTTNSITLLITSNPITIQIKTGETKQIDINSDEVNDFEIKLISIINGKANFSLTKLSGADIVSQEELEKEIRKEALFDVKVSIENLFKIVKSGRDVITKIEVLNVNNIGQVDVLVEYYITDKENNTIAEGSDTLAVEAVASFVRSLKVPYDLKAGNYLFNVDIRYKDKIMAFGSAEFTVIMNYEIIIGVGIIALIIVAISVYLWMIKRREEKLEKKEAILERIVRKFKNNGVKKK